MDKVAADRLKKYIGLIAKKHGGLEGLKDTIGKLKNGAKRSGLEATGADDSANVVVDAAQRAVESMERDREPTSQEMNGLEAIIDADLRPVIDVVGGKFQSTHFLWTKLSTDAGIRGRLEGCIASIGRIELPGHPKLPFGGTGFIVGNGLVMTNRHVAEIFTDGLGTRSLTFKPDRRAGLDFLREQGQPTGPVFEVTRVVMIHPFWDMALLAVSGLDQRPTLRLSLKDARETEGHDIAVIGYPAFDPRNPADVQQNLFDGKFGIKRLQPGELHGRLNTASFQKLVPAATHDCSTLGGNSGSALIDLDTGEVLGLHFGGRYREQNYAVPASELARDQRVVDTGVLFGGTPHPDRTDWADWWSRADSGEAVSSSDNGAAAMSGGSGGHSTTSSVTAGNSDGTLTVEVPIRISISVGSVRPTASLVRAGSTSAETGDTEAMVEPIHNTNFSTRSGYDPDFLGDGFRVPMPDPVDPQVLASTKTGGKVLKYQNFSIKMHAKRRLAVVTASNVTREPKLRKPEPGRDYTRKGLTGLGEHDIEKWFLDPRMDAEFQIPDVFFTKDRKAFDKGHIVRREDVAWGSTYEKVRTGNGDSYHVTNCSPQVGGFNQSQKGEDNWGDLENHVFSQAATERLCVLAGPVLKNDDQVFHGVGDGGVKLRAKIPSRFWKVIVARVEDGIAAYGFVLEQDLDDVQFEEFVVAEEFVPKMKRVSAIAKMAGISFDQAILDADQFDSARGVEMAFQTGSALEN